MSASLLRNLVPGLAALLLLLQAGWLLVREWPAQAWQQLQAPPNGSQEIFEERLAEMRRFLPAGSVARYERLGDPTRVNPATPFQLQYILAPALVDHADTARPRPLRLIDLACTPQRCETFVPAPHEKVLAAGNGFLLVEEARQ